MDDTPKGITGGFAPPTPQAIHTLTRSSAAPADLAVQSATKPDGAPGLNELTPKKLKVDDHAALIEELQTILKVVKCSLDGEGNGLHAVTIPGSSSERARQ